MVTAPYKPILPIDDLLVPAKADLEQIKNGIAPVGLSSTLAYMVKQTAFQGTHLLKAVVSCQHITEPIKSVVVLLRRMIEVSYSLGLLLEQGLSNSCGALLRVFLEIHLSLCFLLQDGRLHEDRALAYMARYYLDLLQEQKLVDASTEEGRKCQQLLASDEYLKGSDATNYDTSEVRAEIQSILEQEKYRPLLASAKGKGKWYQLCGVKDLYHIAKALKLEGTYSTVYSALSRKIHSSDACDGAILLEGERSILRAVNADHTSLPGIAVLVATLSIKSYESVLVVLVPAKNAYRLSLVQWFIHAEPHIRQIIKLAKQAPVGI